MITLKQLEGFFWTAELGGLEQAAQRLNTTQSAISKRLQELETALGMMMFDRSKRRAVITPEGEQVLAIARNMLNMRNQILDLRTASAPTVRTIRLGVTELTAMTWLPTLVQKIRARYPKVTVEPAVDSSVHLVEQLEAGGLDMVVAPDSFREQHFEIVPLDAVEYAWMCSPTYLDGVSDLRLADLERHTLIVQRYASGLGDIIGRWLRDNRVQVGEQLSSSSLTAIASLTLSGLGISYLPRKLFEHLTSTGQLRVIRSTPAIPRAPYVLLYKKSEVDDFMRDVASMATETCDFTRALSGYFATH